MHATLPLVALATGAALPSPLRAVHEALVSGASVAGARDARGRARQLKVVLPVHLREDGDTTEAARCTTQDKEDFVMRRVLWCWSIVAIGIGLVAVAGCVRAGEWTSRFLMEGDELVSSGRNPYFILEPGYQLVLEGGG